eukprot:COSAG06_NODE_6712_length_2813_cov_18.207443_4_plen_38_part_00
MQSVARRDGTLVGNRRVPIMVGEVGCRLLELAWSSSS